MALGVTIMEADTKPVHKGLPAWKADKGQEVYPTGRYVVITKEAASRIFGLENQDKAFCDPDVYSHFFTA